MKHLDFWIPVVGLVLASIGLSSILAYIVCRKKPERDIAAYNLAPLDMNAPLEGVLPFTGTCGVCGLAHGSDAALDGDKQACVDALLALVPKRGDHGRFTKR